MELWVLRHKSVCGSCHPCHGSATAPKHTGVRKVTFKLRRHRLGESIHMTVSALYVLTDRWEKQTFRNPNRLCLCCAVFSCFCIGR